MSSPLDQRLAPLLARPAAVWEVLALRYGTAATSRAHSFLGFERYGEPNGPLQMDFFLWVLRGESGAIVIDTGYDPAVAERRHRGCLIAPVRALELAGVEPAEVEQLVLTHLHYDHIGNLDAFPRASIHVHGRELDFWSGPYAARSQFALLVEPAELAAVTAAAAAGRVRRIEGDAEIAPGVLALWIGGHTPGQMIVLVRTASSLVVLASDAIHFYEELDRDWPFAVVSDVQEMYAGYDVLRELASRGAVILAGHDPAVLERFPRLDAELAALGVRVG